MLIDVGDRVRSSVVFTDDATPAVITDPTAVEVTIDPPGVGTVTYVYGVDVEVVKDGVGEYHVDFDITVNGRWWVQWTGTGAVTAADTTNFLANA